MSVWMKVVAYVLITLFLGALLRELGFKGTRLLILLGTVTLVGASVIGIGELVSDLPGLDGDNGEYASAMLKMVGVGYVFGICSDICSELGESGLGNAVCLFGRVEILALSMPFIKRRVEKGVELI